MKKTIGICLFAGFLLVGGLLLFSMVFEGSGEKRDNKTANAAENRVIEADTAAMEETEEPRAQESMAVQKNGQDAEENSFQYVVWEKNGALTVYESDGQTVFLETNILVRGLEEKTLQKLTDGLYFSNEEDLYAFLESCSS